MIRNPLPLLFALKAAGVPIITTTLEMTPAMIEERFKFSQQQKAEIPVDTSDVQSYDAKASNEGSN